MAQLSQPAGTPTGPHLAVRTMDPNIKQPMEPGVIAIIVLTVVIACALTLGCFAKKYWPKKKAHAQIGQNNDPESGLATSETPMAPIAGQDAAGTAAVDRSTSVRSIMTLPPYRPKPLDNEHVLGREGERDGIDVVVELPTAEEDEALREQEMESLFQIRAARQRQADEREARRQARQEARERNDEAALRAIREQAETASTSHAEAIALLREEHNRVRESRARSGSSVNYAAVGVARNDGTRLRANSSESERVGLLSDAAGMSSPGHPPGHQRGRSTSSVLTVDSTRSDSPSSQQLRPVASSTSQASAQIVTAADADSLGDAYLPPHNPPDYDEVSLSEITPSVSHATSIYAVPPPTYATVDATATETTGLTEARNQRLSAHISDVAAEAARADSGAAGVPQIVIQPVDAFASNNGRR